MLWFQKLVEVRFGEGSNKNNKFDVVNATSFPKGIQILDLSNCDLSAQPDLHSLESLIDLSLKNNKQIRKIEVDKLPKQLKKLDVYGCDLVEQPDLRLFDSLIDLSLDGNEQIHRVELDQLPKKLQTLHFYYCGLTEQPDLRRFNSIQDIYIVGNEQMNLIESCMLPQKLQKLILHNNSLPNLHQYETLIELQLIFVDNKQIQKIDPDKLPKQLQKFHISYIFIQINECGLVEQPDLRSQDSLLDFYLFYLSLNHNKLINKIDPARLPTNIEELTLTGIGITSLIELHSCTNLKELDVSRCKINDINQLQVLKLMPELQTFKCSDNDICENENIKEALALVLTPNIQNVQIELYKNITYEVKQLQTNVNNLKNPFTKKLDDMVDQQFYEEHKDEMAQMPFDIYAFKAVDSYIGDVLQKVKLQKAKVDAENDMIIRVITVGEK